MHATIQKPLDELVSYFKRGEKVFVVGCDNCAAKCHSGGIPETEAMAQRLTQRGIDVVGWCVPQPPGMSLCKLANTRKVLQQEHAEETDTADSFLVLACGQGLHTVVDAVEGRLCHPGCDTIFGGETVSDTFISEYCSLCGQCVAENTGGLCPMTLCSKGLLNGPCGGAQDGMCEVNREQPCGWQLIYERLKSLGRLELMERYQNPKNHARWSRPRSLTLGEKETTFKSLAGVTTVPNCD